MMTRMVRPLCLCVVLVSTISAGASRSSVVQDWSLAVDALKSPAARGSAQPQLTVAD